MTTLIQRAEQARTPAEAVAVFADCWNGWPGLTTDQVVEFQHYVDMAAHAPGDRWKGYLLLAAMAVVPEGWAVTLETWGGQPAGVTLKETRWEPFGQDRRMAWAYSHECGRWQAEAHYLCTALLSAILKTEATNG